MFPQGYIIGPAPTLQSIEATLATLATEAHATTNKNAVIAAIGELDFAGNGAYTVTITVDDGATILPNAKVRLTAGVDTFLVTTNSSGMAVFNVDDAEYTVAITRNGYTFAGDTLPVTADGSATYSMTPSVGGSANVTPGLAN